MRSRVFAAALSAALVAGCGGPRSEGAASVGPSQASLKGREAARAILGENRDTGRIPLAGAQGLSLEDQEAIDRVTDAACATGTYTQAECDAGAAASAARRR